MITTKKKAMTIIAAAMTAVMMSVPVFASSQDVRINRFTVTKNTKYVTPQLKENNSSCYVKLDDLNTQRNVMVNVFGQATADTNFAKKVNCNYGGDDRIISAGVPYFVRNSVNEKGYGYATLGFSRAVTVDYAIAGWWSPDSVYQSGVTTI